MKTCPVGGLVRVTARFPHLFVASRVDACLHTLVDGDAVGGDAAGSKRQPASCSRARFGHLSIAQYDAVLADDKGDRGRVRMQQWSCRAAANDAQLALRRAMQCQVASAVDFNAERWIQLRWCHLERSERRG